MKLDIFVKPFLKAPILNVLFMKAPFLKALLPPMLLTLGFIPAAASAEESITVVSWGGSYARASVKAYHERFEKETGIRIKLEEYSGGLAQVRTQVESGNVLWDVIDMEAGDTLLGCDEGLLEPLDITEMPPGDDGTPAAEDFDSAYGLECGIQDLTYATVVAYNREKVKGKPRVVADFFNLEKFPGRRGMRRHPLSTLEFALVGDGVARDKVYETLSTPEGLDRAFAKLDTIKDQVVWWDTGAQAPQMLADGEVVMSIAWNGRIFNAQALENQPIDILWDGQLQAAGYKVIVAGTPRLKLAKQFVAFANSTQSLANITKYISYGPMRKSSMALVDKHEATGIDIAEHLPSRYSDTAVIEDPEWWADHLDDMNERFAAWLSR